MIIFEIPLTTSVEERSNPKPEITRKLYSEGLMNKKIDGIEFKLRIFDIKFKDDLSFRYDVEGVKPFSPISTPFWFHATRNATK